MAKRHRVTMDSVEANPLSIGKRVAEAAEKMAKNDPEGALLPISVAIEATAKKVFNRGGRESFKSFLHQYLGLITKVSFGSAFMNITLKYKHPDLKRDPDGTYSIQSILYHVVRCGLAHSAELPSSLTFVDENRFQVEEDRLVLPASIILGLIIAVVVCPENRDQTIDDGYAMKVRGFQVKLKDLWGKKVQLENLFAAMDAVVAPH